MKRQTLILSTVICCVQLLGLSQAQPKQIPVDCPTGWKSIDAICVKLFPIPLPYRSARTVCKTYGADLVVPKDYYNNDDIGQYVKSMNGNDFWIGTNRIGIDSGNQGALNVGDALSSSNVGIWSNFQPTTGKGEECVYVTNEDDRFKWSFGPCEKKNQYVCSKHACAQGTFRCSNNKCLSTNLTCDGENDCGDMSDEMNCPDRCGTVLKQATGTVMSKNYPKVYADNINCYWLVEVPLGSNAHLKFTNFSTEGNLDIVKIYAGGKTESTSKLVASLSGDLTSKLPEYTSSNNFLIVKFSTDSTVTKSGFKADFLAKKETFPLRKQLMATDVYQTLTPPSYPNTYLGSQDYTWIIEATLRHQIITLEIMEVDLRGDDVVMIRDGDMVFHTELLKLDSSNKLSSKFVFSSRHQIYITMHTQGYETGKGFKLNYKQGCSSELVASQGTIVSPGFTDSKYPNSVECDYVIKETNSQPMTLSFLNFKTKQGDSLKVYQGVNDSGTLLNTFQGSSVPQNIVVQDGKLFLKFKTDGSGTEQGFKASFSVDCPAPNFNDNTITSKPVSTSPDTVFDVSCKTGYHFAAQEFRNKTVTDKFVSLSTVKMVCGIGGSWNNLRFPSCEPRYCGEAPAFINGYAASSTGVTFGKTATYACYDGYNLDDSKKTITCTADGSWTNPSMCGAVKCSTQSTTLTLGTVNGSGNTFGTKLSYECDPGYNLVGSPNLFCQSNTNWTHDVPSCQAVNCFLPVIKNGYITDNTTDVVYKDSRTIVCDAGYAASTTTLNCRLSGTFGTDIPTCDDVDECNGTINGGCAKMCHNLDGSYKCSCPQGYTLANDGKACLDINECATDKGGCSDNCTDGDGTYACSCDPGRVLFSENGVSGYDVKTTETGMMSGDKLRINHTCVPKKCGNPMINGNIMLLSKNSIYRFEDTIEYACPVGFTLTGERVLQCTDTGTWNSSAPSCTAINCTADIPTTTLQNMPSIDPANGTVMYEDILTMNCSYKDGSFKIRTRKCLYNHTTDSYSLEGEEYECGVIDCGTPPAIPGAIYTDYLSSRNSSFGATYPFKCDALYELITANDSAPVEFSCKADGKWDFGDLYCKGVTCTDPRRPVDGFQTSDSYEENKLVTFGCSRPGFTLDSPYAITCEKNSTSNGLQWNASLPECVDTQKPVLTGCQTILVEKYDVANIQLPTFADNDAIKSVSVTGSAYAVITQDTYVTFQVTDLAGNSESCAINITVKDTQKPMINCPASYTVYIDSESSNVTVDLNAIPANATDNSGSVNPIRYNPPTFTGDSNTLGTAMTINAYAKDVSGNEASCTFQIHTKAKPCSPLALMPPANTKKECSNITNGFTCNLTCKSNHLFFDQSDAIILTCLNDEPWNTSKVDSLGGCAKADTGAKYKIVFEYPYQSPVNLTILQSCIDEYTTAMKTKETELTSGVELLCQSAYPGTSFTITVNVENVELRDTTIFTKYGIIIEERSNDNIAECAALLGAVSGQSDALTTGKILGPFSHTGCTPVKVNIVNNRPQVKTTYQGFFCENVRQLVTANDENYCLLCPEGYFNSNASGAINCKPCPIGQFSLAEGLTTCQNCSQNTNTYKPGAYLNTQCKAKCPNGSISITTLPPCDQCPRNTYWLTSSHCESCPDSGITRKSGANSVTECQSQCAAGSFSDDGHEPCRLCPVGFYSTTANSTDCMECSNSEITSTPGANSTAACISGNLCIANPCQNNGTCEISAHVAVCTCLDGYYGDRCQTAENPCSSSPCKNNGTCNRNGQTTDFTCVCKEGTSGPNCETDLDNCFSSPCSTNGMCQDELDGFMCHCKSGFKGITCDKTADVCEESPCKNGATCERQGTSRRKCNCTNGFTGDACDVNIDDCARSPCLGRGSCKDEVASFDCNCYSGFNGTDCSVRENLCEGVVCANGMCVDEHIKNNATCVCNEGYMYDASSRTCTKINYCQVDPCTNGATCASNAKNFTCSCASGYTGSVCQHNIDNCANHVCGNDSISCQDGLNIFNCTCKDGFEGDTCQTMINKCPSACIGAGVTRCDRIPNDYVCVCKPGYTGRNCETDINECASSPCLRESVCINEVNAFSCNCSAGWTGTRCETMIDKCSPSPCDQSATKCTALLDDYYCSCPIGRYGKNCETIVSLCTNVNPCVNNQTCVDEPALKCQCSTEFSESGCQITVDYCAQNVCENGGICKPSLTGYSCECKNGYQGKNCDVNPNNCDGVTCPPNAVCVDGEDKYFCRCPQDKVGADCAKDLDTNYDLLFDSPMKNGMAALPYPIPINSSEFSLSFWVRFWDKDDTGNILSVFFTESQDNTKVSEKFFSIDSKGIKIMNGSMEMEYGFDLGKHNDGRWHHIVVIFNGATGTIKFVFDSLSDGSIKNFANGKILKPYLWIVLGVKYDIAKRMPEMNKGFNGWLSQINLYNRALDFSTEIAPILNAPARIYNGTILRWSEYVLMSGVQRVPSSIVTRAQNSCPRGFSAPPGCLNQLPAKTEIKVESCPKDVVIYGKNRVTEVTWTAPQFSNNPSIISTYPIGSPLLWGKYNIKYEATSSAGAKSLCIFDVFVQFDNCTKPADPLNGEQSYITEDKPYIATRPDCKTGYAKDQPMPILYTCGPVGSWDPPRKYNTFVFPPCGVEKDAPQQNVKLNLVYKITTDNCPLVITKLTELIRKKLVSLNPMYDNKLCAKSDCSDVVITVNCVPTNGRRKKRQTADTTAVVTLPFVPSQLTITGGGTITPTELINQLVLDNQFDFKDSIAGAVVLPNDLNIIVVDSCPVGQTVVAGQCVECSAGTFFNNNTSQCQSCAIGTYQIDAMQTSCIDCAKEQTTENVRSALEADCKRICPVGQKFDISTSTCSNCSLGFYQNITGMFFCEPCPADKTTREEGANSVDQCFNDCPPGKQIGGDGTCVNCTIDTYRGVNDLKCVPCDPKTVTPAPGATSKSECTLGDCQKGYKRTSGTKDCEKCPVGTYQDQIRMSECISCGGMKYRTESDASKSKDDCKFFCPDGQEQESNQTKCIDCPVGSYRNSSNPTEVQSKCRPCVEGYRTKSTKSVSIDECSIYKCLPGKQPIAGGSKCEECPKGYYQPLAEQENCTMCISPKSTKKIGSQNLTDCESYCPSGQQKVNGSCDNCTVGYYKDNNVDLFSDCTLCPSENITATTGASSLSDCNVRNCSAGYKRVGSECVACAKGKYQDKAWQTKCETCPTSKTTENNGTDSLELCILTCDPGKEDVNGSCAKCQIGFYKSTQAAEKCKPCVDGKITREEGATKDSDCDLAACSPGNYRDNTTNTCKACDYGTYQTEKWMSSCSNCPSGRTTHVEGANASAQCVLDCEKGFEFDTTNNSSGECKPCPRGEYRDKTDAAKMTCVKCPPEFITPRNASTNSSNCSVKNCTETGQYQDTGSNTCKECPVGQYQDQKWRTECKRCPDAKTTQSTGSSSVNSCKIDCIAGKEYNENTAKCEDCAEGKYRNKTTWVCQTCPGGLSTFATGATSVDECTRSPCTLGQFYDRNTKACAICAMDTYQALANKFDCNKCPTGKYTKSTGTDALAKCLSKCDDATKNTCSTNALCTLTSDPGADTKCTCKDGYQGNGKTCTHKCDSNYCGVNGDCQRGPPVKCFCKANYEGVNCATRADPSQGGPKTNETIMIAVVTAVVILLFIILLVVCLCVRARKNHLRRKTIMRDDNDDRLSYSTKNYDPYGSRATSLGNQRLMLPSTMEKMYDNPVFNEDPAVYRA